MNKNVLVVGYGQIGKAIYSIEEDAKNNVKYVDIKESIESQEFDVMHICIPYVNSEEFLIECEKYLYKYPSELIFIHSTVQPGVSEKLSSFIGKPVIHSPVMGKHPDLKKSILSFVKFVSCDDDKVGEQAIEHLLSINIKTSFVSGTRNTELAKLLDTTRYGIDIAFATYVKQLCDDMGCRFEDVYTNWTDVYNDGYKDLFNGKYVRPNLQPNTNGLSGHCVAENLFLLKEYMYHPFIKHIFNLGKNIDNWTKSKHHNKYWLAGEYLGKDKSVLELSQECNVSKTAIRNALKKFNINSIYHQPWTEEEDSKLQEYSSEMTFKRIAEMNLLPYRTYESIRIRASQLKISSEYNPGEQAKNLSVRTKISCTLQNINEIDFIGFKTKYYSKIRRCDKYNYWRSSIFERDNYTCQLCKKTNTTLHAHHIKKFSEILDEHDINTYEDSLNCDDLWDIDNGITYCEKCHLTKIHNLGKKK